MTQELTQAIVDLREDDALAMVDRPLAKGPTPSRILADCKAAMDVIGDSFANGEAFIPELIIAGEIMTQRLDEAEAAPDRPPRRRTSWASSSSAPCRATSTTSART